MDPYVPVLLRILPPEWTREILDAHVSGRGNLYENSRFMALWLVGLGYEDYKWKMQLAGV